MSDPTAPLNPEQESVLAAVKRNRNIFLTGVGGTGKSHTIRAIQSWATTAGLRIAVTAMTGCAALLLGNGAKTLHSWAGVGLARESPHDLAEAVKRNRRANRRWLDTHLLIIDEVSMMTPEFFEKLDLVARRVRKRPDIRFGGLQLLLAGDFCQLPPVTKGISDEEAECQPKFIFETPLWKTLIDEVHELTTIVRQSDPAFQRVLTEARMGRLTQPSIDLLTRRKGLNWQEQEVRPTLLFTRNAEVNNINAQNMAALEGERRIYDVQTVENPGRITTSTVLVTPDDPDVKIALERLDSDAPYERTLELCVGAQVMLITNLDQEAGLVNGSRGVITGYSGGGLPIVRFLACKEPVLVDRASWWLADYEGIGRAQIPLKVAYAVTIHKAQGATLDSALDPDIGPSTFEFGQAYVALSRVRSLAGLYIWKFDPRKIRCHPTVVAFYDALVERRTASSESTEMEDPQSPLQQQQQAAGPWTLTDLSPAWRAVIDPYLGGPAGQKLTATVMERAALTQIQPEPVDVFAALRACPDPATIKVIILGQDPYPTAGNAHGLAFSVRPQVTKIPPSLQNIFKELATDLALPAPTTGCLQAWGAQGVLLLNDILTVSVGAPLSHAGIGWEALTTNLLAAVLKASPHTVLIVWGRNAQKKLDSPLIKPLLTSHTVLQAPHPSPLSAHTGFFGSKPFSQTNRALSDHGQEPIDWRVV